MCGMKTSTIIRSKVEWSSAARPVVPPSAIATLKPYRLSQAQTARRICGSSSTTRMRRITASPAALRVQPLPGIDCAAIFTAANQCAILISASMRRTVCPQRCIAAIMQLIGLAQPMREAHLRLIAGQTKMQVTEGWDELLLVGKSMSSGLLPSNHLLQSLPAAEFEALGPHLESVEMVREVVLVEAGAPLTHVYLP